MKQYTKHTIMNEIELASDYENRSLSHDKGNNELQKAQWIAENKKLLSIIGHDIKSPMSSIISLLKLIEDNIFEWELEKIKEYIGITVFAANKSISLLDSILEWAMAVNMSKTFRPERIEIKKILEEEIENLLVFALPKQIKINSLISDTQEVFADKNMTMTIIRNLLNNAIKYSHNEGEIDIKAKKNNGFLEISIKDYGVGIPKSIVKTLLNSDINKSQLGTNNEQGTGFGLLLCHEFIDIHKGEMWIVSTPDEGSEFTFTLPLADK